MLQLRDLTKLVVNNRKDKRMVYLVKPAIALSIPDILVDIGYSKVPCKADVHDNDLGEMTLRLYTSSLDVVDAVTEAVEPLGCDVSSDEVSLTVTIKDNDVLCKKLDIWDSEMFRYELDRLRHVSNLSQSFREL